jgi:hypothetical protein
MEGGWGGQIQPRVFGTLIYKEVKLETAGLWFEPNLNIHTPLYPTLTQILFYLPLNFS